jgi:hypothetical protein
MTHHSPIVLRIKSAFRFPPLDVEAASHAAIQTSDERLSGACKRPAYGPVTAPKQAAADRFKNAIVMAVSAHKPRPMEK